jgi:ribosomal protein S18 acetylase RimI-like enzyme
MTNENVSFNMVRPDMENIPVYELPPGYHFRSYRPGDDHTWLVLQRASEPFIQMGDDYFDGQFGADLDALPGRMFFVESPTGEVVGAITAWWEKERHNPHERGRIHWVAVHPAHRRRGLSKPMMTHAMQRLAQDHPSAVLGTSSGRPWAVKVYLDFGFQPEPSELTEPDNVAAWQAVQRLIQHPALAGL